MSFEHKYLKYKQKYLELKNELIKSQNGGNLIDFENSTESLDIERLTETPSFKKAFGLNKNNYSKILEKDISLEKILQNGGDGHEIDTDSDDLPDKLETVTDVHEDDHNEPGHDGAGEDHHNELGHDGAGEPPVHDNEPGHDGAGEPPVHDEPGHDGAGEPPVHDEPGHDGAGEDHHNEPGHDGAGEDHHNEPGHDGAGEDHHNEPGHDGAGEDHHNEPGHDGAGEDHHNEPGHDGAGEDHHDEPGHDGAGEDHHNEPGHDGAGEDHHNEPGHDGAGEYNATDTANETQVDLDKMLQAVEPYDHNEVFTLNAVSSRSQLGGFLNMKGGDSYIVETGLPVFTNGDDVAAEHKNEPGYDGAGEPPAAFDSTPHSTAILKGGNEDLDTSISELDEIFSQLGGKKKSSDKDSIEEFLAEEVSESSDEFLSELDSSSSSDFL